MFSYLPQTQKDIKEMLEVIGVDSIDDLFKDIPKEILKKTPLDLPKGISEYEVLKRLTGLSEKNRQGLSFMGCGSYDHLIPSVVKHVIQLPNFYTAYTPYQAEISQGILQSIFEFQTLVCELTGMEVSNASLYDDHTAASEAITMAINSRKKADRILVSGTLHPNTRAVIETFFSDVPIKIEEIPSKDYVTSLDALKELIDESVAAVLIQTPNIYGWTEDLSGFADLVHENKALFIVSSNPMSLGILKSQADWGADIAIGGTQPFGLATYFGGPSVGYISTGEKLTRKMPGRIVGQTEDVDGKRAFVLTLQAREQHIKRQRATSNICSNQALAAMASAVYLSTIGWKGLKAASSMSFQKAHYLYNRLTKELGLKPLAKNDFFNEFTLLIPNSEHVLIEMESQGIFAGVGLSRFFPDLGDAVTIAVTEKRSKEEIDAYVELMKEALK
ncbi:MAG: aminomethyl-transferring glycine dehydrogenase subunit GcvPA [Spirochaetia bacterium]|jgi:glycine dehydrogenase subunit 1|nr:aminomethyl-transferring glycine dehydrogenase subunit GcvPA [Spirochaetia bacterium]